MLSMGQRVGFLEFVKWGIEEYNIDVSKIAWADADGDLDWDGTNPDWIVQKFLDLFGFYGHVEPRLEGELHDDYDPESEDVDLGDVVFWCIEVDMAEYVMFVKLSEKLHLFIDQLPPQVKNTLYRVQEEVKREIREYINNIPGIFDVGTCESYSMEGMEIKIDEIPPMDGLIYLITDVQKSTKHFLSLFKSVCRHYGVKRPQKKPLFI